ncbi:MAG: protein phosphatase CheZ [Nitrospirota bacterium]
MSDLDQGLFHRIVEVSRYIDETVQKLSKLDMPAQMSAGQLPQASKHLSDLIRMTEEGTHRVMELAEEIQGTHASVATALDALGSALAGAKRGKGYVEQVGKIKDMLVQDDKRLLDIMTALSFQDLAGQRIKKIMTILDDVQRRLLEMVVVFGGYQTGPGQRGTTSADEMLRQLDASKTSAQNQDLVDQILGQFGRH